MRDWNVILTDCSLSLMNLIHSGIFTQESLKIQELQQEIETLKNNIGDTVSNKDFVHINDKMLKNLDKLEILLMQV